MSDTIYRQAAIDLASGSCHPANIAKELAKLPSAQSERKKGKWEEKEVIHEWQSAKCSVCGKYHTTPYLYYFDNFNYCPNCGAKMEGAEE